MEKAFKNRIIYQIYPLSFCDSNNDGYGDINGIISKLDYLKELGVGIIWLSPIYKSPMKDNGYDIADYYDINPIFGTMADFDNLLSEAKKRDIKIVMDLVVNHTSSEHIWFKEALKDPNSKYRNYYFFRKGNGKKPPNNRDSKFTGSCWEKVPGKEDTYYMHLFTKEQVDLNYQNEEVIKEVENILKFYLDKGVYGFRCDVINLLYKTSLENGKKRLYDTGKEHYESQEGCYKVLKRIREEVLDKYDTFLVGETSNVNFETGNRFLNERCLDMFFEFDHAMVDEFKLAPVFKVKYKSKKLINSIFAWQENIPWIGCYLENHDQRRSVTRFGVDDLNDKFYKKSAKALAMFLFSLKGTIFLYEGQEIGMTDYKNFSIEDLDDCASKYAIETVQKILKCNKEKAFKMVNSTVNRDHARSPMQWDNSVNAGFNSGHKTWLKVNENYLKGVNVEEERKDSDSILNFYKKMIKFRNESNELKFGSFERVKINKNVASFKRKLDKDELLVVVNLSNKKIKYSNNSLLLLSNEESNDKEYLKEYEGRIYKVN